MSIDPLDDKHTYLCNDQIGFVANGALCGPAAYSLDGNKPPALINICRLFYPTE
jgi:hypothetical protein